MGRALPDGASLAAKTGTLAGGIRNEIGVITHADGRAFAAAFFTRAHKFLDGRASIELEMARSAASMRAMRCPMGDA
jgi:beta-lactamase class A